MMRKLIPIKREVIDGIIKLTVLESKFLGIRKIKKVFISDHVVVSKYRSWLDESNNSFVYSDISYRLDNINEQLKKEE